MEPNDQPFDITMPRLPHGFVDVTKEDVRWFEQTINSDIRFYYKMIRNQRDIVAHNPIGISGITAGELALYIIRQNHTKRRRRY
jgi:hypothetical protein